MDGIGPGKLLNQLLFTKYSRLSWMLLITTRVISHSSPGSQQIG